MPQITLNKSCPSCSSSNTLFFDKSSLSCSKITCSFNIHLCCPLCHSPLHQGKYNSEKEPSIVCKSCSNIIVLKKLKYLIENGLIVDYDQRCSICNGPSIHRKEMNLSHRCFHYPRCSGQRDLFSNRVETFVFLDFETTGLEVGNDHIIEIGALKIDEDGYDHTYQSFIKPPVEIKPHITKITGITQEMVADAPDLAQALPDFIEFIGTSKLVAHNAEFDVPWLLSSVGKSNLNIHTKDVICTLKWAKEIGEAYCSLGALTKKYGIGHANAHRALADAVATKELFFIFQNQRKCDYPKMSINYYESILNKITV